jgi:hypothetical protein
MEDAFCASRGDDLAYMEWSYDEQNIIMKMDWRLDGPPKDLYEAFREAQRVRNGA